MPDSENPAAQALDTHLRACQTKDVTLLREAFTPEATFVGTDDGEVWPIEHFAKLMSESVDGWTMVCDQRKVSYLSYGHFEIASFLEFLTHAEYGKMRGSGILLKNPDGDWKIHHYVLSFSIPNEVVDQTDFVWRVGNCSLLNTEQRAANTQRADEGLAVKPQFPDTRPCASDVPDAPVSEYLSPNLGVLERWRKETD